MARQWGPEILAFSDGTPMANQQVAVVLRGSLQLASLFANAGETASAANPATTDGTGALVFFADQGFYDLLHEGERFPIAIDEDPPPASVANLTYAATVQTNALLARHFRLTAIGDATLAAPTNPLDAAARIWEITASGAQRLITLATGAVGSFELTEGVLNPLTIPTGKTGFLGCQYNATRQRWTALAWKVLS